MRNFDTMMRQAIGSLAILFVVSSPGLANSEVLVALHPDFPVVSGDFQLSADWSVSLPEQMNRRVEDQDLVLWRPGFTVWMSLWGNDKGESMQQRIDWIRSDTSPKAFDQLLQADDSPARYSYRLNEDREHGVAYALYGFVLKADGHLQVAIYVDSESDIESAKTLLQSVR